MAGLKAAALELLVLEVEVELSDRPEVELAPEDFEEDFEVEEAADDDCVVDGDRQL